LAFVDGGGSGTLFSTDELKALDGTLEHHEGQIKSVILKTFRTKTIDELEADNIERVFEELHEALDKKLVRNYLRDALDGRRIALKEVFASELIIQ
jgi:flagellar basal body-associated protein FliL